MYSPERLFADAESLMAQTAAEGIEVSFHTHAKGLSRFANTAIHQNMAERDRRVTCRVAFGQQVGVASGNDCSPEGLIRTLRTAETIAQLQRPNLHFPGFAGPQTYRTLATFDQPTADFSPLQRATALKGIFDAAIARGVNLAGSYFTGSEELAIANSAGLRAYQPNTFAALNVIALTDSFSAGAQGIGRRVDEVDVAALGTQAIDKALLGQNPADLEVGAYDVVMEPSAICELIEWIGYVGLGSRAVEEETSFLAGRQGERIAGDNITLYDNAFEGGYTWAFDQEGTPKQEVRFLDAGVAGGPVYDRIAGHKAGHPTTGHSAGPTHMGEGAVAMHINLQAGTETRESLIGQVERGIYITRTHYVNGLLDPRVLQMTGLTRDGAFLIENGKLTRGLKNMRFTESILGALNRVAGLSKERDACPAWWGASGSYLMPYVLIKDFTFTGKTDH